MKKEKNIDEVVSKDTYSKDKIVNSKKYANQKDLVNTLLNDDKKYTLDEVDKLIEKFKKGEVN